MITRPETARLVKAFALGAPFAAGLVFSFVLLLVSVFDVSTFGAAVLLGALAGYSASLAGLLWATGFWGRLPIAFLFGVGPLLVIVDYVANPFFPSGVLLIAVAALGIGGRRDA